MAVNISFDPSWGLGLMADAQARRYEYNYRDKTDAEERGLRRELAGMDDRYRYADLTARVDDAREGRKLQGQEIASREKVGLASAAAQQTNANANMLDAETRRLVSAQEIEARNYLLSHTKLTDDEKFATSFLTTLQSNLRQEFLHRSATEPPETVAASMRAKFDKAIDGLYRSPEISRFLARAGYPDAETFRQAGGLAGNFIDQLDASMQSKAALIEKIRDGRSPTESADAAALLGQIDASINEAVGGVLEVRDHMTPETQAALKAKNPDGFFIFKNPAELPGRSPYVAGTDTKATTGTPQTGAQVNITRDKNTQAAALVDVAQQEGYIPQGVEKSLYADSMVRGYGLTADSIGARQAAENRALNLRTPEGQTAAVNAEAGLRAAQAGAGYSDAVRRRSPINSVFDQIAPTGTQIDRTEDRWGESIFRPNQTSDEWRRNFTADVETTERQNRAEMQALAREAGITDPNSPEYWDFAARATWASRQEDIDNSVLGFRNPIPGNESRSTLGKLNADLVRKRWQKVASVNSRRMWQ